MPLELQPLEVHDVIDSTLKLLQPLADRRDITIDCDGPPVTALGDRRRLRQVIINLVSNAIRFSGPGSIIRIGTEPAAGAALLHIIDQGPGIPPDLLDRLFVPFDRLGADAGREGGAGLGLVLARRLTEAIGGTLELDSAVGRGTHATVALTSPERPK
jgi:signal transduction histidine kinase